jgi:hypothetical protein
MTYEIKAGMRLKYLPQHKNKNIYHVSKVEGYGGKLKIWVGLSPDPTTHTYHYEHTIRHYLTPCHSLPLDYYLETGR